MSVESVVRCSWNGWPDDRGIRKYSTKNEQFRRFHWVLPAVGRLRKNAIISPPSFYTPFIVISPGL
ncbi:hypothetical protein FA132_01825 [Pseudomonas aeruginosa]|nr:hypothetical protein [Pseudomonas aeruginosa]